jgi:hypothetical protein
LLLALAALALAILAVSRKSVPGCSPWEQVVKDCGEAGSVRPERARATGRLDF